MLANAPAHFDKGKFWNTTTLARFVSVALNI
jgi:hypothetical protein